MLQVAIVSTTIDPMQMEVAALAPRQVPRCRPVDALRRLGSHGRNIGYVLQDYKLLSKTTVAENVTLALAAVGKGPMSSNGRPQPSWRWSDSPSCCSSGRLSGHRFQLRGRKVP